MPSKKDPEKSKIIKIHVYTSCFGLRCLVENQHLNVKKFHNYTMFMNSPWGFTEGMSLITLGNVYLVPQQLGQYKGVYPQTDDGFR